MELGLGVAVRGPPGNAEGFPRNKPKAWYGWPISALASRLVLGGSNSRGSRGATEGRSHPWRPLPWEEAVRGSRLHGSVLSCTGSSVLGAQGPGIQRMGDTASESLRH